MVIKKESKLYHRLTRGVAESSPERAGELEELLATYTGDPNTLATFLDKFGSDNPWEAAERAALKSVLFRAKKEIIAMQRVHGRKGKADSRYVLTRQLYFFVGPNPTQTWVSGAQAITKIMQAFGTKEQKAALTPEGREYIKKEKRKAGEKSVQQLDTTLEEFLKDPSKIKDVRERQARAQLHAILGLDEELKKRMRRLDELVHGNTAFVEPTSKTYLLYAERGGRFLGWFKKKADNLPTEIKHVYELVTDNSIILNDEERRFAFGALIAYAAANTPIDCETAVGGYQADLEHLLQLPDDDELFEKHGPKPDLTSIRHILSQNEITLIDATRVIDVYPLDKVREEVNGRVKAQYETDTADFLDELRPLFINPNTSQWREDALGASTPMKRLKESVYSVGLTREDFAAVQRHLRLETLTRGDEKRLLQASPLGEYKALVETIALAARKTRFAQAHLKELGVAVPDPAHAVDLVKKYRAQIRYFVEKTAFVEAFAEVHGITLEEVALRASTHDDLRERYGSVKRCTTRLAPFGLYDTRDEERLADIAARVRDWVPAGDLAKERLLAEQLKAHPLVKQVRTGVTEGTAYYTPKQASRLKHIAGLHEGLDELLNDYIKTFGSEKLDSLFKEKESYADAVFYTGGVEERVIVHEHSFKDLEGEAVTKDHVPSVAYYDPVTLSLFMEKVRTEYQPARELSGEWRAKATFLVDHRSRSLRQRSLKDDSTPQTYYAVKNFDEERGYVHKELVREVNELYNVLSATTVLLKEEESVISAGRESYVAGALLDKYRVIISHTSFDDKNAFRSFFSRNKPRWNSSTKTWSVRSDWSKPTLYKHEVQEVIRKVVAYNNDREEHVRVQLEPVTQEA